MQIKTESMIALMTMILFISYIDLSLFLTFSASGTNHGAIDNRIEQAMVSIQEI